MVTQFVLKLGKYWPWKTLSSHLKLWFPDLTFALHIFLYQINLKRNTLICLKLNWNTGVFFSIRHSIRSTMSCEGLSKKKKKKIGKTDSALSLTKSAKLELTIFFFVVVSNTLYFSRYVFTTKYKWIWIPNYQPVFHQRINYFFIFLFRCQESNN